MEEPTKIASGGCTNQPDAILQDYVTFKLNQSYSVTINIICARLFVSTRQSADHTAVYSAYT
jgi:hypothetical protein